MDKMIRLAVIVAVLLAGVGVFYHYVIFLPSVEQKKAEAEQKKADLEQSEKQKIAEKESARKVAYNSCVVAAATDYESNWATACEETAKTRLASHQACLSDPSIINNQYMGEAFCKRTYPLLDGKPDCALPMAKVELADQRHAKAKERCLAEAKSGL